MSTKFYNDIKGNDLSEFLAASEVYSQLIGEAEKTASNEENMSSFLLEVSRERNRSPHSALNNVDIEALQKIAEDVGVVAPTAYNTSAFVDKVEFAADCGRNMAHEYVKQANFGSSVAKFVAKNPRAAVGMAGAGLGAAGGYVAGDGEGAVLGGLAGGVAGAMGGKRLIGMASGKKAILGKGVQTGLNNAQRELTTEARMAKGRLTPSPAIGPKPLPDAYQRAGLNSMEIPATPTNVVTANPGPVSRTASPNTPVQVAENAPYRAGRAANHPNNDFHFAMEGRAGATPAAAPVAQAPSEPSMFSMVNRAEAAQNQGIGGRVVNRVRNFFGG